MPKQKILLIILSCFVIFGLAACTQTEISKDPIIVVDENPVNSQNSEISNITETGLNEIMDIVDEKIHEL